MHECKVQANCDPTQKILKSFYLMRCRELTKGYGLPEKYFSPKVRCPHCFVDWEKGTEVKVEHIRLSHRQKRRIKQYKLNKSNKDFVQKKRDLLKSNKIEQICEFCKNAISTITPKPLKFKETAISSTDNRQKKYQVNNKSNTSKVKENLTNNSNKIIKPNLGKSSGINVYSKSKDAFSLGNKNNTLQGVIKPQKVVKNNKKKKDKFAGLCQQAVLAAAKLKEEKRIENKLNLFLKPSST
ncbi:hypothetical protein evm_007105 [Chilo suppressalis]|nr:hypothetical protein evm_007105 [Chilo suppressalis]